jgi:NAD(P)-dependent dehydrogenase (short-subunit alcohol dehydrogenase family)
LDSKPRRKGCCFPPQNWRLRPTADTSRSSPGNGRKLPVGRVGEAEDLAEAYLYLMREGYSTGQMIVVDGGAVLV